MRISFRTYRRLLRTLRLQDHEKNAQRSAILQYMSEHPMPARSAVSPFHLLVLRPTAILASMLVIVLISGSGLAYAAERSLPGSPLYPVKTAILEPLRDVVTITPEAQLEWEMTKADRRLKEAEQLLERSQLTAETSTELAAKLQKHAAAVTEQVKELSQDSQLAQAADVTSSFTALLQTHRQVLARLSDRSETKESSRTLLDEIDERNDDLDASDADLTDTINNDSEASRVAVSALQNNAAGRLSNLRELYASRRSSLDRSSQEKIDQYLEQIDALMEQGATLMENDPSDAFLFFQEANHHAQEATALLNTQKRLKSTTRIKVRTSEPKASPEPSNEHGESTTEESIVITIIEESEPADDGDKEKTEEKQKVRERSNRRSRIEQLLPNDTKLKDLELEFEDEKKREKEEKNERESDDD